jgi:kynurenine formamidase
LTESGAQPDVGTLLADVFRRHRVADLTLLLDEPLPGTWPGHMPYRATVWSWFADRPGDPQPVHAGGGGHYQTRWLVIDEHTGTHVDAPRHFIPPPGSGLPHAGPGGDIGVSDLPLLATSGPAAVIDVRDLDGQAAPGHSPAITPEHVTRFEDEHGPLRPGDAVLFRTGWDARYRPGPDGDAYGADVLTTGRAAGWPAPRPDTIELLRERGVTCVGTDGLSMGPAEGGAPTHLAALPHGVLFVEALGNLAQLPPRGAWFLFLPLRISGGTGAPGRALAVLPDPASPA